LNLMGLFRRRKTPPAPTPAPLSTGFILSRNHKPDIPCACGYNLRGLAFRAKCPECGRDSEGFWLRHVASNSGQSDDAVLFVFDVITSQPARRVHLTAAQVCELIRNSAVAQCGSEPAARRMLSDLLGLAHGEQIGAILFALVDADMLQASPDDSPDDFDSLPLWPPIQRPMT
jgi:uncharacterized repeat protein (TIGR04138 family)